MENTNPDSHKKAGKVKKVPVIMQMEALECGAASLAMILAYHGKWVPLEQVRSDCGVSRDGSSAKNIFLAAKNYGLEVEAYRAEPEALRTYEMPCIIHWNFNHFVVLDGFKRNKAVINDPARGEIQVSLEEFDESFTGVVLTFAPGENFVRDGHPRSMWRYALERVSGARSLVIFSLLLTAIGALMGLVQPFFSKVYLDYILPGSHADWVWFFFAGLVAYIFLQLIIAWINAVYSLRFSGKMDVVGSSSFMWKILRLPMEFFSQRMAGDVQQRMRSNATIAQQMAQTFAPLLIDTGMMFFYLFVLIRYSVPLTVVGILGTLFDVVYAQFISGKRVNITRVQMRDAGKKAGATVAGIEMIESIKASGAENGFFERWAGYQASANAQSVRYMKLNALEGQVPAIIEALLDSTILLGGIYLTMQGNFTVGSIVSFSRILTSFTGPAKQLLSTGQLLQEMRTQMERVEDVMSYPLDPSCEEARNQIAQGDDESAFQKLAGHVELRNVTFGYSKLGRPLIENFSMEVKPGSKIAFVGETGCGKSTLSKLISGLYKPWSGEILFDGKPMDDIDHTVFTGSLAVVDQDIILFEDTISNNIRMWDETIEDFEVILAARDAQIHDDIMLRDGGYQYKLSEGGNDFSGGQRQRLEIARVLAQDPTILILDEATSALDAKTEHNVVKAIQDRGITCIVIAHRLSTIRDCDEIIVLDHGKVAERGTHDELMKHNGLYTRLVTSE